jgi:hypothetical protein
VWTLGTDDDSSDGECEKEDNAVNTLTKLRRRFGGLSGFSTLTNGKHLCPLGR